MRKASFLTRFLLLLICSVLLVSCGTFLLSSYFSESTYTAKRYADLAAAHAAGRQMLDSYERGELSRHDLSVQLDPMLNTTGAFWMLFDRDLNVIAASRLSEDPALLQCVKEQEERFRALPDRGAAAEFSLLVSPGNAYELIVERTGSGFVLTGLPGMLYAALTVNLRMRMLISFPILILLILFTGTMLTRRGGRTVRLLTDAANRIREGESLTLPGDMPGEAGEIARAFNYMTDAIRKMIGDLQYEKETMELILEGINEGILAADRDGTLLHRNSAALKLLGREDSPAYRQVWQALCEKGEEKDGEARTGKLRAGDRVLEYTVAPLPASGNELSGTVALIRDITEEERLERTRHDYVANISHELRTPLASIRGLAEGLRDGMVADEEDRKRYFSMIADESNRLSRLVNDLLELSGLQADTNAFETEKVDPFEVIYDLYDRNLSLFEKAGIAFERVLPENELPVVFSNEDRLCQVLTIFLDNARKYTPAGGRVQLGAGPDESGVRFFVRDNGIGMDEETCRLAFERFHQAEKSRSDKGSGLGLAIAREIMQKLGIPIMLTSAPGEGSEFSFAVPLKEGNSVKAEKHG